MYIHTYMHKNCRHMHLSILLDVSSTLWSQPIPLALFAILGAAKDRPGSP